MTAFVALLRGINVGTAHRVAMSDLRTLLSDELGYEDVRTVIVSGNVSFTAGGSAASHEKKISAALAERFGFAIPTQVRTATDVRKLLDANPFAGAPVKELHVVFLSSQPDPSTLPAARDIAPDEVATGERCVYLRLRNGFTGTKIPDMSTTQKGLIATSRTVATIEKLLAVADA